MTTSSGWPPTSRRARRPTSIFLNYRRFASFADRGVLEPLGPRLAASSVIQASDFAEPAMYAFRFQGDLVCMPQNVSSLVVYYDKDLFDAAGLAYPAAGWTWDDFLTTAQSLTQDLDGDGTTDQYGLGTAPQLIRAAPFIWQHGGELVVTEPNGEVLRLAVDSRPSSEAIEWFTGLQTEYRVVPDRTAETAQDSESRFMDGTTAMFLQSRRPTPTFRDITAFDWDVAPLPQDEQEASILHSDGYCMPADAANKDAAWTFIEFANTFEGQEDPRDHRTDRAVADGGRRVARLPRSRREAGEQPGLARRHPGDPVRPIGGRLARGRGDRERGAGARLLRRCPGGRGHRDDDRADDTHLRGRGRVGRTSATSVIRVATWIP